MNWLIKWVMCALMPHTDRLPGLAEMDVDGFLRRMRRESAPFFWWGLVGGALLFTITPVFTIFLPLPAFLLPVSLVEKHAEKLRTSPIYVFRQVALVVRLAASLCWGVDDRVRAAFALKPWPPDPGTMRLS